MSDDARWPFFARSARVRIHVFSLLAGGRPACAQRNRGGRVLCYVLVAAGRPLLTRTLGIDIAIRPPTATGRADSRGSDQRSVAGWSAPGAARLSQFAQRRFTAQDLTMKRRIVFACLLTLLADALFAQSSDVRTLEWESLLPRQERENYQPRPATTRARLSGRGKPRRTPDRLGGSQSRSRWPAHQNARLRRSAGTLGRWAAERVLSGAVLRAPCIQCHRRRRIRSSTCTCAQARDSAPSKTRCGSPAGSTPHPNVRQLGSAAYTYDGEKLEPYQHTRP